MVEGKGVAAEAVAPAVGAEVALDGGLGLVTADVDGAPIDDKRQRPVVGARAGFLQQVMARMPTCPSRSSLALVARGQTKATLMA